MKVRLPERNDLGDAPADAYERDFHAWAMKNAELLRQGRLSEIDTENIAEELETMGRSERRELVNRLTMLLAHLLKWRYQPENRSRSWRYSILEQRRAVSRLLRDSPSLRAGLNSYLADAYEDTLLHAAKETGLDETAFPPACPWSIDKTLEADYWPE
jgi:iron-sulfur cluster repair protein YtfE (RIC family)